MSNRAEPFALSLVATLLAIVGLSPHVSALPVGSQLSATVAPTMGTAQAQIAGCPVFP